MYHLYLCLIQSTQAVIRNWYKDIIRRIVLLNNSIWLVGCSIICTFLQSTILFYWYFKKDAMLENYIFQNFQQSIDENI